MRDFLSPVTQYDPAQYQFDSCVVEAAQWKTTMLAMQAYDVIRSMDYLTGSDGMGERPVVLVGEGLGGVWALVAAAFDARAGGVVCVGTVPSYHLIVDSHYYAVRDYYWVARALEDFDISDLPGLIAPKPVAIVDPLDAMLERLEPGKTDALLQWPINAYQQLAAPGELSFAYTFDGTIQERAQQIVAALTRWKQDRD